MWQRIGQGLKQPSRNTATEIATDRIAPAQRSNLIHRRPTHPLE